MQFSIDHGDLFSDERLDRLFTLPAAPGARAAASERTERERCRDVVVVDNSQLGCPIELDVDDLVGTHQVENTAKQTGADVRPPTPVAASELDVHPHLVRRRRLADQMALNQVTTGGPQST